VVPSRFQDRNNALTGKVAKKKEDDAMAKTMTASVPMTDGQVETAVNLFRDAVRKHRSEFSSDVAQQVLGTENLGMIMFSPFRERAEAVSKMIVHTVAKVDRTKTPKEVLDATGRTQYTDADVVKAMPHGTGEGAEVIFFKPEPGEYTRPGFMSDDDLEKALARRGFTAADPYSLATDNIADPAFADEHPNGTHWQDANGKWCFATFNRWHDERYVDVDRSYDAWNDRWWFAGVRK
jgi:hypothetical protein